MWFGGVGGVGGVCGVMVVCWWHVGGVLPGGVAPCGLVVRGVCVAVSMYVCVDWGCSPMVLLVCWWFGGLVIGGACGVGVLVFVLC